MRHRSFIYLLLLLTGCTSPLQQLKNIHPAAEDFPSSLASEYLAYADSEAEQGRQFAAEHYAGKGMKALKGEKVEPEAVDAKLPPVSREELTAARAQLMTVLNDNVKQTSPQKLAHAQLLFDCWQYELKRNLNQEKAPCGDEFKSTMAELQEVADPLIYSNATKHAILFAEKSTALSDEALATIKDIATQAKGAKRYTIQISGHIGKRAAQRTLSERRLSIVRKAFVQAGIPPRYIRVRKHGGAKAVVLSGDALPDTKKIFITLKIRKP